MSIPLPEYDRMDALALGEGIARGDFTAPEVLEAALARADARNPRLNAIVARYDDEARARARGPLPPGPLSGVPFLVKDLLTAWKDHPITGSSRALLGFVPRFDSEVVRRLIGAGLVLFGQTNTPELGVMGTTEPRLRGPTRNPWNRAHTPGGSSGGSAAAIAARIVPAAHGNDAGGSLRIPASCCGIVGLKPSRGRVSFAPAFGELMSGLASEGVMTRSVRDAAAFLDVLAGPVAGDPYHAPPPARPFRDEVGAPPGRLRVAFTRAPLFAARSDPECEAAVDDAAALLQGLGHEVVEARPAFSRDALVHAYLVVVCASVAADLELAARATGRRVRLDALEPETAALVAGGQLLGAKELALAEHEMHAAARSVAAFMEGHDVLVTSTMARPPARLGTLGARLHERIALRAFARFPTRRILDRLFADIGGRSFEATGNTMLFNQTGQPAVSVPLHWTRDGLPVGVQLVGRSGEEGGLLRLAAQLEAARPWAGRAPPAAA